jgi:hypothetical protein
MSDRTRHDAFSIKFYNQGVDLPTTNPTRPLLSNIACPYHSVLLQSRRQSTPQSANTPQTLRLQDMQPVGLTQRFRVGTAASAGCTCALARGSPVDNMAREINAIVQASNRRTINTSLGQR